MSKNKRILLFTALLLLLFSGCQQSAEEKGGDAPQILLPEQANYRTTPVETGAYTKSTKSAASLLYPVRARLYPQEDDIRIKEILVEEGDEVKQGDVLVVFDIEQDDVKMEELKVSLKRTEEKLEQGKSDRQEEITEAKEEAAEYSSHKLRMAELEIEKKQVEYEQFVYRTEQEIAGINKQIADLEKRAKAGRLTAPFDGVIDAVRDWEAGDLVWKDTMLVSMHSPDIYQVEVTDAIGNLRHNMDVVVEADFQGEKQEYKGVVVSAPNILPGEMSQESIVIRLEEEIVFNKKWGTMYCSADVEEVQDVLLIDKDAVNRENSDAYVYILDGDTVKKRFVTLGPNNMEVYWVLDGLKEGQLLILD